MHFPPQQQQQGPPPMGMAPPPGSLSPSLRCLFITLTFCISIGFRPPPGMAPPPGFFAGNAPPGSQMSGSPSGPPPPRAPGAKLINGMSEDRARMLGLI